MKHLSVIVLLILLTARGPCMAQSDHVPSETNQPRKEFTFGNSEGRVRASILEPEANKVQLAIGGVKYDLTKDDEGVWTGESAPQDERFHYYQLNIDEASVPDPGIKEADPFPGSVGAFREMLKEQGIDHVYYESPETAHEWLTSRRSLYQYAQLLFQK